MLMMSERTQTPSQNHTLWVPTEKWQVMDDMTREVCLHASAGT